MWSDLQLVVAPTCIVLCHCSTDCSLNCGFTQESARIQFFGAIWSIKKHTFGMIHPLDTGVFYDPLVQVLLNHARSFLWSYFNARNAFYSFVGLVGPQHLICISWFVWKWGYPPFQSMDYCIIVFSFDIHYWGYTRISDRPLCSQAMLKHPMTGPCCT